MNEVKTVINELKDIEEKVDLEEKIRTFKKEELVEMMIELLGNKRKFKVGRKDQIAEMLMTGQSFSVQEIADTLNISTKNVSSQFTYLRKDGYEIATRSNGKKYLENIEEFQTN